MAHTEEFITKKPGLTMHNLFIALMVMFVFSLAFVLGFNYFFENTSWHGQATQYLCPSFVSQTQPFLLCFQG